MRVLLLNQFFWPDSSATSQLLTDLARGLVDRGHDVSVISGDAGYAVVESGEAPPVTIHRVKALPFGRGKAGRVLSYLSFYLLAAVQGFKVQKPDLVITLTTPPLLPLLGTLIKRFRGAKHFIWEMDMYPDVALDVDYFKAGGMADRVVGSLADFTRHQADGVIALGECMKDRLMRRGIGEEKIFVADNWADGETIQPIVRPGDPDQLILLYSGNLGLAHDLDTVAGAIRLLAGQPSIRFLFVGGGARKRELASMCEQEHLANVQFGSYVARAQLGESLGAGDIGLVTQRDECCGSVVPSKVYGLLAAGRPLLFIGPAAATPARIIRKFHCGWHIPCGDVAGLVSLLGYLDTHRDEVRASGERARRALLDHYDRPKGVSRLCSIVGAETRVVRSHDVVLVAGD